MKKKLIATLLLASILVSSITVSAAAQTVNELEPVNVTMISDTNKIGDETIRSPRAENQPIDLEVIEKAVNYEEDSSTSIVVDKEFYDTSANREKREINQVLKDELDNKKKIIFYGDKDNLNLEQLAKTIDHKMSYTVTPEGESAEEAKNTYAYSFERNSEGNMLITQYIDTNEQITTMEENIDNIINHRGTETEETTENNQVISTQLKTHSSSEMGDYVVVKTNPNIHITMHYELKRVKTNSSYTTWDVKLTNQLEPFNSYQCYVAKLQIYRPDKGLKPAYNETLLDYSPETTNGSSGYSVGVSVSGGGASASGSFSQSIQDATIAVSNQGYDQFKQWDYNYKANTNIAKGSTKQTALTRWANAGGLFKVSLNSYCRVMRYSPVSFPVASEETWFLRIDKNDIK